MVIRGNTNISVTEVLINHSVLATCLLENHTVRWVYVTLWTGVLLFKYAGKTVILNLSGCVWLMVDKQVCRIISMIYWYSKAQKQKKKSKKAILPRRWTVVQWSIRRAEEQMRCGWRGDLGMWVDCRADEGSRNRCIVECSSQWMRTGGKVRLCRPC